MQSITRQSFLYQKRKNRALCLVFFSPSGVELARPILSDFLLHSSADVKVSLLTKIFKSILSYAWFCDFFFSLGCCSWTYNGREDRRFGFSTGWHLPVSNSTKSVGMSAPIIHWKSVYRPVNCLFVIWSNWFERIFHFLFLSNKKLFFLHLVIIFVETIGILNCKIIQKWAY